MSTANLEKDEYSILVEHEHQHDHDHGPFIAHHFETAEQQFDSGKLGIWLFLITEVLFFSGLFVAYTLYRYGHPDIFLDAHVHLDKFLGGINTVVLLFSSLTMAWAVRAAQMGNNRLTAGCTLVTMVCAAAFLGVKAVEYSHKWDVGLFPGNMFDYVEGAAHPEHVVSPYLMYISAPFLLLLLGFAGAAAMYLSTGSKLVGQFHGGMAITCLGYFLGVAGGMGYMAVFAGGHDSHDAGHGSGHAAVEYRQDLVAATPVAFQDEGAEPPAKSEEHTEEGHEDDAHSGEEEGHGATAGSQPETDGTTHDATGAAAVSHGVPDKRLGVFFSIYYCMTGLHAIHIIGGIAALAWIFYRSLAAHWRSDYFGPVDFVGLYWHLVDLIWIYLFPLMYLIK